MYTHILVAVDGSQTSILALQHACGLARDQKATLRLIYVVDEVNINLDTPQALAAFLEAARHAGHKILEQALAEAHKSGVEADTRLLEVDTFQHRIADQVLKEARAWPADLIVLGTHGRRGLTHLLLGSVAESIVRLSPLPVLLIRGK
jgi:nucleotide-binding universal stress UspA family protein